GDRAVAEAEGVSIPVKEIAIQSAKDWLEESLRFVDPNKHMDYQVELKPGSAALKDIFERKGKHLSANDTSAAVGYAPLTETEEIVLEIEKYVNSEDFKKEFPEAGEDVKVMGFRKNSKLDLTLAIAFVDKYIESEKDYFKKKSDILNHVREFVNDNTDFDEISLKLNTLDDKGRGVNGVYTTVLGTSADGADSGQVGRGNRPNGVIPLNRPTGTEAAAGKNPVSHVGKIYNLLTDRIAHQIYGEVSGLKEIYVWLVSQIGQSIDQPAIAFARVIPTEGTEVKEVQGEIEEVMNSELENIDKFCKDLSQGKISVC
ncbi:MAG: methionine adenosyltransferase, partial [Hadesarchaea archaeon]|nr:methionine adenosyltransferase [Hadesarchaea archaeon]